MRGSARILVVLYASNTMLILIRRLHLLACLCEASLKRCWELPTRQVWMRNFLLGVLFLCEGCIPFRETVTSQVCFTLSNDCYMSFHCQNHGWACCTFHFQRIRNLLHQNIPNNWHGIGLSAICYYCSRYSQAMHSKCVAVVFDVGACGICSCQVS